MALGGAAFCLKCYLLFDQEIELKFEEIDFREKKLFLKDVVFLGKDFSAQIDQLSIHLFPRFIEVEGPKIFLENLFEWKGKGNWNYQIRNGKLFYREWEEILFSAEKNWPHQVGRFFFEQKDSSLSLEAIYEGKEIECYANFDRFDLSFLKEKIDCKGKISGWLHLTLEEGLWKKASFHIGIEKGGYQDLFSDFKGEMSFDGSLEALSFLDQSRFHLHLEEGKWRSSASTLMTSAEDLAIDFSFVSNLGLKWDFKGKGLAEKDWIPLFCEGRSFLYRGEKSPSWWAEAKGNIGEAELFFQADEKKGWKGFLHDIQKKEGKFLQTVISSFEPKVAKVPFEDLHLHVDLEGLQEPLRVVFQVDDWIGPDCFCQRIDGIYQEGLAEIFFDGLQIKKGFLEAKKGKGSVVIDRDTIISDVSIDLLDQFSTFSMKGKWEEEEFFIDFDKAKIGNIDLLLQARISPQETFSIRSEGKLKKGVDHFSFDGFSSLDEKFFFDLRLDKKGLEVIRLAGDLYKDNVKNRTIASHFFGDFSIDLYEQESHFFNSSLSYSKDVFSTMIEIKELFDLASIFSLDPFLQKRDDLEGLVELSFDLKKGQDFLVFSSDQISWKRDDRIFSKAKIEGSIDSSLEIDLKIDSFWVDLESFPYLEMKGSVEGEGFFSKKKEWELSFDLGAFSVEWKNKELLNQDKIHWSLDSQGRFLLTGLNLICPSLGVHLQSDLCEWILDGISSEKLIASAISPSALFLHQCRICTKESPSTIFPTYLSDSLGPIDVIADLQWVFDRSYCSFFMKEGQFLWKEAFQEEAVKEDLLANPSLTSLNDGLSYIPKTVHDFSIRYEEGKVLLSCNYPHEKELVHIDLEADLTHDEHWNGICFFQEVGSDERLYLQWNYFLDEGLWIETIEGSFSGLDLSFHQMGKKEPLIGSAKVDFSRIRPYLSPRLIQLVDDLKMGQGYEFKGILSSCFLSEKASFEGILSGKQIDLFGYQFRTLLAKIAMDAKNVVIQDLKIADLAGTMTIDQLVAREKEGNPWTLSIPKLNILELRPSLLQKANEGEKRFEEAGPLVVRKLSLLNLEGLLDEPKTYQAQGTLSFINSYRREHTVFDIPSDFLSRIAGLDLELLIPVRGVLDYELKEGIFSLQKLTEAYSEAGRSQFFLVQNPSPIMDLDGNLKIFVQMKQFVLFKLTESLLISIDGNLSDPQFHLQKKAS